jgi:hypothetical protein
MSQSDVSSNEDSSFFVPKDAKGRYKSSAKRSENKEPVKDAPKFSDNFSDIEMMADAVPQTFASVTDVLGEPNLPPYLASLLCCRRL